MGQAVQGRSKSAETQRTQLSFDTNFNTQNEDLVARQIEDLGKQMSEFQPSMQILQGENKYKQAEQPFYDIVYVRNKTGWRNYFAKTYPSLATQNAYKRHIQKFEKWFSK